MLTIRLMVNGKEIDNINVQQIAKATDEADPTRNDCRLYEIIETGDTIKHRRDEGARKLAWLVLDYLT